MKRKHETRELNNYIFTQEVKYIVNEYTYWEENITIHEKDINSAKILLDKYIDIKREETKIEKIEFKEMKSLNQKSNSYTPKIYSKIIFISNFVEENKNEC